MSLLVTLPILVGLGGRMLLTTITAPELVGAPTPTIDLVIQGVFQGVLLQYVATEHPLFAPALGLAFVGRSILDFSYTNYTDVHKLATTLISAVAGFAGSYVLSILYEEFVGPTSQAPQAPAHRSSRRRTRDSAKDARRELTRARLREINARERSNSGERISPREYEMSSPGTERYGPTRAVTEITLTSSTLTMEQMGYTGLGRLLDLELANLRKKAATAEADRRRCKEEKKWAIAQGDKVRAQKLGWQVKRYAAMAESYTREADRRIIEATRAAHPGQLTTVAPAEYPLQYEEKADEVAYEQMNGHELEETPVQDDTYAEYADRSPRKDKGKAAIRSVPEYPYPGEPGQYGFDSGWQTSKAFS